MNSKEATAISNLIKQKADTVIKDNLENAIDLINGRIRREANIGYKSCRISCHFTLSSIEKGVKDKFFTEHKGIPESFKDLFVKYIKNHYKKMGFSVYYTNDDITLKWDEKLDSNP